MRRKHKLNKLSTEIEPLLSRYFEDMQKKISSWSAHSTNFDQNLSYEKVQQNIRVHHIRRRVQWFIAASVALFIMITVVFYMRSSISITSNIYADILEKQSASNEIVFLKLSDGTKIWLNGKSKITYPRVFDGNLREVTLSGEAYFEVEHQIKPFIIHVGKIRTQVLGTSFNINAYQQEKTISVTVLSGKVGVNLVGKKAIYLVSDQQAVFNKEHNTFTRNDHVDTAEEIAWRNTTLIYKRVKLEQVLADITHKYKISVHADPRLLNCAISADLGNKPVAEIMKILAEIVNGRVVVKQDGYQLIGTGCQ